MNKNRTSTNGKPSHIIAKRCTITINGSPNKKAQNLVGSGLVNWMIA